MSDQSASEPPAPKSISLSLTDDSSTAKAIDPVCGMSVAMDNPPGGQWTHNDVEYYFCSPRCRARFSVEPEKYLSAEHPAGMESPTAPPGAKYVCPMCPGVESDKPASCPKCGMALEPMIPSDDDQEDPELRDMKRRLWVGIILGIPLVAVAMGDMLVPGQPLMSALGHEAAFILQAVLATPIVFWCGGPFFARAWRSLCSKQFNMFTLIGLGVGAAYLYSLMALIAALAGIDFFSPDSAKAAQSAVLAGAVALATPAGHSQLEPFFESAAMIVILVLLGQVMELRARMQTGEAVRKLLRLAPKTARVVLPGGREVDRRLNEVCVGDLVRIRPGERVPVDGEVTEGTTTIDESMLTGEPIPVVKVTGAKVMAGTENGVGSVLVKTAKMADDSLLAQVIRLVGHAQRTRVPLQQRVDLIASYFVPAVIGIAVVTFCVWLFVSPRPDAAVYGTVCAIAVLVIACPCALGLATPLALVVGMGRGAGIGVLFRDAAALERLASVDTIVFDKTGTLTEGKPRITTVVPGIMEDPDKILSLAAAVERGSEHPIGRAVVWEADRKKLPIPVATDVSAEPGKGIQGNVDGQRVTVGTLNFLRQRGVHQDLLESQANRRKLDGESVVWVATGSRCIGLIGFADPLRPTTDHAVTKLRGEGLRLMLLSGDAEATAQAVARKLEIEEVKGEALPAEKYAVIVGLKKEGRIVAMAGDGINDAPALAASDVGIALGSGTDVAITAAGVTLIRPDLRVVAAARSLSRATVQTIRGNLVLAFMYNVLAIPVAAGLLVPLGGGLISPIWAAAAMSLSSTSVVLNSLRLNRAKL